jgi:hypothetical protein
MVEDATHTSTCFYMKKASPKKTIDAEPMGIVISRGSRTEQAPTVLAYVWGPAPEPTADVGGSQAAA